VCARARAWICLSVCVFLKLTFFFCSSQKECYSRNSSTQDGRLGGSLLTPWSRDLLERL